MEVEALLRDAKREQPVRDRVRRYTAKRINHKIDEAMMKRVMRFAKCSRAEISARIGELDAEWDVERVVETGAGALALGSVALSRCRSRKWLLMTATTLGLLLQHSITRKSLPLQAIRALGIRTRREIDAEKYALRMLRGDFDHLPTVAEGTHRAIEALRLSRS